ncbi:hypothetical protein Tco_1448297 [Tanacetum coccineum]
MMTRGFLEDDDEEEEEHLAPTDSFDVPVRLLGFLPYLLLLHLQGGLRHTKPPLSPLSSPLPQIPSPPLPLLSPPTTSPTYAEAPLGYRTVGIRYDVYLRWTSASESEHVSLYLLGVSEMRRFNSSAGCRASGKAQYSEEEVAETMAGTIEQYMSKTRADYGSGVARPKIEDKDNFELKGQFLKELLTNTFSGSDHEDANGHIEKVLEIVDLFHIPNITLDQVIV